MRPVVTAAVLFAASLAAVSSARSAARADEPKKPLVPTIAEIMQEAHGCRTAYIKQVAAELRKDDPDWTLVEEKSRELVRVGKLLALNTPPSGTRESWEKITNLYVSRATVLTDAAERKDKEEAALTARRITSMCGTCHRAHRSY